MDEVTVVPQKPKRRYKKRTPKAGFKIRARGKTLLADTYSVQGDLIVAVRGSKTTYVRVGEAAVVVETFGSPAQLATTTSTGSTYGVYGPEHAAQFNSSRNRELDELLNKGLEFA